MDTICDVLRILALYRSSAMALVQAELIVTVIKAQGASGCESRHVLDIVLKVCAWGFHIQRLQSLSWSAVWEDMLSCEHIMPIA